MKVVFNDPKSGNSFQKEVDKSKDGQLVGKKIGDSFEGAVIGLDGYALEIRGGSTKDGFPLKKGIPGSRKVKATLSGGTGVRGLKKGEKLKKTVVGSTISDTTMQVNAKIVKYGPKQLDELGFVPKKAAEKKDAPAGEAKPASGKEAKAEKKEEAKPAEAGK